MRVLACGDRNWTDRATIKRELAKLGPGAVIVHGAARGADSIAGEVATDLGFEVETHPAQWNKYGRAAGVLRNQEMLETGVDLVLAFHPDLAASRGTGDMVRRAQGAGVPTKVVSGDGVVAGTA